MNQGRRLIMRDDTVIEDGEAGYVQGNLWLWFRGYTLQQAAEIAFNPLKTGMITFEYGEMSDTYEGFTRCMGIQMDMDGRISVCLTQGE